MANNEQSPGKEARGWASVVSNPTMKDLGIPLAAIIVGLFGTCATAVHDVIMVDMTLAQEDKVLKFREEKETRQHQFEIAKLKEEVALAHKKYIFDVCKIAYTTSSIKLANRDELLESFGCPWTIKKTSSRAATSGVTISDVKLQLSNALAPIMTRLEEIERGSAALQKRDGELRLRIRSAKTVADGSNVEAARANKGVDEVRVGLLGANQTAIHAKQIAQEAKDLVDGSGESPRPSPETQK